MEKLIEIMLNEGLDENQIFRILEKEYGTFKEFHKDMSQVQDDVTNAKTGKEYKEAVKRATTIAQDGHNFALNNPGEGSDILEIIKTFNEARKRVGLKRDFENGSHPNEKEIHAKIKESESERVKPLNCSLSESCFNDIVELVGKFLDT